MKRLFLLSVLFFTNCSAWEGIQDFNKHKHNQKILQKIIQEELSYQNTADHLSQNIAKIGTKALQRGFDPSAYCYNRSMGFTMVPLWEGKSLPLTFFVYVWPPEQIAKPYGTSYETVIHDHPMPCALTVLSRSIVQVSYEPLKNHKARPLFEETLRPGDAAIDDNSEPFVHKLVCRESGREPAVTLHAYGAPTADQVLGIFTRTLSQCPYHSVD